MATKRFASLKAALRKKIKGRGISDNYMEKLEDRYHVDLTHQYGEDTDKNVNKIISKIAKNNPKRRKK